MANPPYTPRDANSTHKTNNRYTLGGTTDVFRTRIGWWERIVFPTSLDDIPFTLGMKHANNADLIAYEVYGKESLEWLVLQFNNIVDPLIELVPGATIYLPQPARVFSSLLNKTTPRISQ